MRNILALVFTVLLFTNCKKDDNGVVPYAYVNVSLYAADPQFSQLNAVGGYIFYNNGVSSGYKGLIIYKRGPSDYVAYERACTYDPESSCGGLVLDNDGITLKDSTCCESKFILVDGSISHGPATYPLLQYHTSFDGTVLNITN